MRRIGSVGLVLGCLVLPALADFKVPKHVFRMSDLEAAKAEALEEGRPLTFVYSDENTTCGLCAGASLKAMDGLRRKTVVVYADCRNEVALVPPVVREALNSAEAGRFIPKTVIVDSAMANVLAVVPYARGEEMDRLVRKAVKDLPRPEGRSSEPVRPAPLRTVGAVTLPVDESREMRAWQSRAGSTVTASLVQESGTSVILQKEDGSRVKVLRNSLSAPDQEYIQDLKARLASEAADVASGTGENP